MGHQSITIQRCNFFFDKQNTMKIIKHIFFSIFSLINVEVYAQSFNESQYYQNRDNYKVVDSANIKCYYKVTYLKDSLQADQESIDQHVLLIGDKITKYYSQLAENYNTSVKEYLNKTKGTQYMNNKDVGSWTYEVFRNYPEEGKQSVTDLESMLNLNYLYEEDIPTIVWNISNEKQIILNYSCTKATTTFRGRQFNAWFTTEIPIPYGPWKFGGLPGLILKISDSKNNFVFECEGFQKLRDKENIKFYNMHYTKGSRLKLWKTYKRFHDDMIAYKTTLGMKCMTQDANGNWYEAVNSTRKIPYNPIELE